MGKDGAQPGLCILSAKKSFDCDRSGKPSAVVFRYFNFFLVISHGRIFDGETFSEDPSHLQTPDGGWFADLRDTGASHWQRAYCPALEAQPPTTHQAGGPVAFLAPSSMTTVCLIMSISLKPCLITRFHCFVYIVVA